MSEHTPLTEAERRILADRVLGGAEPSPLMVRAVETIIAGRLAARTSTATTDDVGLTEDEKAALRRMARTEQERFRVGQIIDRVKADAYAAGLAARTSTADERLHFGYLSECPDGQDCAKPGCLLAHARPPTSRGVR